MGRLRDTVQAPLPACVQPLHCLSFPAGLEKQPTQEQQGTPQMFDALNKFGLPAKYAILIGAASVIAIFILNWKDPGAMTLGGYAYTGLLGVIFGAAAGYMRQMRGMTR